MTNLTPAQLQEDINRMSEESFELHQELAVLNEHEGLAKLELMKESKTGKEVDMKWAGSKEGSRQAYLKAYLKGLSHLRSARLNELKANSNDSW
jgi:hypothetical protein